LGLENAVKVLGCCLKNIWCGGSKYRNVWQLSSAWW